MATCRAFTLIELVAVLIILGIICAIAVPSLSRIGRTRSAAALDRLAEDVQQARQMAVARGGRIWIVFSTDTDSYELLIEDKNQPGPANRRPLIDPSTGKPFRILLADPDFGRANLFSVDIDGGNEIGFDYLGRPLNKDGRPIAANGRITFGDGRVVEIGVGSGHVRALQ